jgi:hypothetical protein
MPLTPEEERQLEYLLRKKYCNESVDAEPDTAPQQAPKGPAKMHGDIIDVESKD